MSKPTLNHSIKRESKFEALNCEGRIPDDLRGVLYRTGPGLLERFGQKVPHPFDADGAVTAVNFNDIVTGATKVIKSKEFLEEEAAQRFLYGTLAPWHSIIKNNLAGKVKSTGNTNILAWNNKLYALMEMSKPVEIDSQTLATGNVVDFNGQIKGAFSAHPHRVAKLKTTFNFGVRRQYIDMYAMPDNADFKYLGSVQVPWEGMIHDFIMTEKYFVFFIGPVKLIKWRAFLGYGDMSDYFKWEPESGMQILVVPIDNVDKPIQIEVDAFWVWHFVNAYDDNGEVVVEAIRHADFGAFEAPSSAGPEQSMPSLHRFRINLSAKIVRGESLWLNPCEFPSVHPLYSGAKNKYIFLQTFNESDGLGGGIALYDCKTGAINRWLAPQNHMGSEPVFVAKNAHENEGYFLQLIKDPSINRSYLAILESEKLEAGPVAKVWFNEAIPMTFHGTFVKTI